MPRYVRIFLMGIILILGSQRHQAENIPKNGTKTPQINEQNPDNNKSEKEQQSNTNSVETKKDINSNSDANLKNNSELSKQDTSKQTEQINTVKLEEKKEVSHIDDLPKIMENDANISETISESFESTNQIDDKNRNPIALDLPIEDTIGKNEAHVIRNDDELENNNKNVTTEDIKVEDKEEVPAEESVDDSHKEIGTNSTIIQINSRDTNQDETVVNVDSVDHAEEAKVIEQTNVEAKPTNQEAENESIDPREPDAIKAAQTHEAKPDETIGSGPSEETVEITKKDKQEPVPQPADQVEPQNKTNNNATETDKPDEVTEKTTENADEKQNEENVKLEVDSIQSFEEWKKKQIQDREDAAVKDTFQLPPRAIRTKKTQVNYASQDCGAKILTSNPESKHESAILDENKDLYMLNPCSANIWFVVELCEPIQIRQLQLANLELFSSSPRIFEISISERYPAREWRLLGTFEARNDRTIQTFAPPREELMFAKYIKFEMKSHFGKEHFCPLTLIRVLGVSMVEEYEETEEKNNDKSDVTNPRVEATTKQTVTDDNTKVVGTDGNESGSIEKMFNIVKNAVGNLLGNGGSEGENVNATSLSNLTVQESNKSEEEDRIDPKWESPVTLVTNKSEVAPSNIQKIPIVVLVEQGDGREFVSEKEFNPHLYPLGFLGKLSPDHFTANLCWFLELVYRVSVMSCIIQPYQNQTSAADPTLYSYVIHKRVQKPFADPQIVENVTILQKLEPPIENATTKVDHKNGGVSEEKVVEKTEDVKQTSKPSKKLIEIDSKSDELLDVETKIEEYPNETKTVSNTEPETKEVNLKQIDEAPTVEQILHVKPVEKCENPEFKAEGNTPPRTPIESNPSPGDNMDVDPPTTVEDTSIKEGVVLTGDVTTDDVIADSLNIKVSDDEANSTAEDETQEVDAQAMENEKEAKESSPNPPKEDTPPPEELQTKQDLPEPVTAIPALQIGSLDRDQPALNAEEVVINPGTNQKESVLMRLSNRIRALEQNLSLSSDYLEDLSQRYKRQMDEMQKAFNRTKTRLTETSRRSEEKEQKQDEAIQLAKTHSEELQKKLDHVSVTLDLMNQQMIARHLVLMALESCLCVLIFFVCLNRRQKSLLHKLEMKESEFEKLLQATKASVANGHIHMNGSTKSENRKTVEVSKPKKERPAILLVQPVDEVKEIADENKSISKSASSLHVNKKKTSFASSPIHKRKYQQMKPRKTSASSVKSLSSPTLFSSIQSSKDPPIFPTFQIGKKKKGTKNNASKNGSPKTGTKFSFDAYADPVVAPICGKSIAPWNNTSSILSGKAR